MGTQVKLTGVLLKFIAIQQIVQVTPVGAPARAIA